MSPRRDSASLLDIVKTCQALALLIDGEDEETFVDDLQSHWAILYGFTVLGEATKRLSCAFRSRHPTVLWRQVAGMQDIFGHDSDEVDLAEVWRVVTIEVPALLAAVEPLVGEADVDEPSTRTPQPGATRAGPHRNQPPASSDRRVLPTLANR